MKRPASAAIIAALVALVLYFPAVYHDFTYDDVGVIIDDTRLDEPLHGVKVWLSPWWKAGSAKMESRPLTSFSFWLQVQLHGRVPMYFHAVNVLLFSVLSAQLALLAWRWLGTAWAGWGAGLLFAVHPVHVEVVANVVGRAEVLSAVFVVLAMQLWLRWRREMTTRRAVLLAFAILFAGLSKESGYLVAPMLGCIEVALRRSEGRPILDRPIPWNAVIAIMIVALLAITQRTVMKQLAPPAGSAVSDIDNPLSTSSRSERVVTPFKVLGKVSQLLVFPIEFDRTIDDALDDTGLPLPPTAARETTWRFWEWSWYSAQSPDYSPRMLMPTNHVTEPLVLLGFVAFIGWCGVTIWTWRIRHAVLGAMMAMPIAWAIPSNTVVMIGTILGERLITQLSIFVPIAVFGLLGLHQLSARANRVAVVVFLIVISGFIVATINYRSVWHTGDALSVYMVSRHPLSGRFQGFMARRMFLWGEIYNRDREQALKAGDAAKALSAETSQNEAFRFAEYHAKLAMEYWPRQSAPYAVMGAIEYHRGNKARSLKLLKLARRYDPRPGLAEEYLRRHGELLDLKELERRKTQLEAELARQPDNRETKRRLAKTLLDMKEYPDAIEIYDELYAEQTTDITLINEYVEALLAMEDFESGTRVYERWLELEPDRWDLYVDAAIVATYASGDENMKLAKAWAERAVAMNPASPEAHMALGQWYQVLGRVREAEKHYRNGIRVAPPDDPKRAHYKLMLERLLSTDSTRRKQ